MLNFLKYLSDKTFSGAELMVLTIVYKDTRFGNGCYKSVRTLADNTPFDISKSSVSNAVRSLLKKGYIERLYDEAQDALYLKAVNVDCERLIKQPNNITIEHPEKVKKPKFAQMRNRTYKEIPQCSKCMFRGMCCSCCYSAYGKFGSIYREDPHCADRKQIYLYLMQIAYSKNQIHRNRNLCPSRQRIQHFKPETAWSCAF